MSEKEKIDLRSLNPSEFPIGTRLQIAQLCECLICGFQTSDIEIDNRGKWGMKRDPYIFIKCENIFKEWHSKIIGSIDWLHNHPHPKSYKVSMAREIKKMRKNCFLKYITKIEPSAPPSRIIYFASSLHICSLSDFDISLGPISVDQKKYWVLD